MYSIVIPVYKNEDSIPDLLESLARLKKQLAEPMEVVFVVDASPDKSFLLLKESLSHCPFQSKLILHSRNFGAFSAIRTGLQYGTGPFFGVLAADLQDPPSLLVQLFQSLESGHDVVIGRRDERGDPFWQRIISWFFWWFYRWVIQPEMPRGGADIFGCNETIRNHLLSLRETNTTLIGLVVWLGFNREVIPYKRRPRRYGKSTWTFQKKIQYGMNSLLAFSDFPLQIMILLGGIGLLAAFVGGGVAVLLKVFSSVHLPSATGQLLTIIFFGGINSMGIGIVGSYVWRTFENTKERPMALVVTVEEYPAPDIDTKPIT